MKNETIIKQKKTQTHPYKWPKRLYPDIDNNIEEVATSLPIFIVLNLTEEKPITKLSPLTIEGFLSAKNSTWNSERKAHNCSLIMEVVKKKYAKLLSKIKISYVIVKIDTYIPNPPWCYNCQQFGHIESKCPKKPYAKNCREADSEQPESTCKQLKCTNSKTLKHGKKKKR